MVGSRINKFDDLNPLNSIRVNNPVVQYNILLSPAAIVDAFKEGKLRDEWKGSKIFLSGRSQFLVNLKLHVFPFTAEGENFAMTSVLYFGKLSEILLKNKNKKQSNVQIENKDEIDY
uniref:Uncharacterized protein n=1 Tax=Rhizophagus irregularis (strain DAOM 181602 / DAOM 197198 / MUCL 43194) TaxID=747089 RepID=U9TJF5_RHIID